MHDGWPVYNILQLVPYIIKNEPNDELVIFMKELFPKEDEKKIANIFYETFDICSDIIDSSYILKKRLNDISFQDTIAGNVPEFLQHNSNIKETNLKFLNSLPALVVRNLIIFFLLLFFSTVYVLLQIDLTILH